MGFLTGKRILIVGVASKKSLATGIAQAMHREGAELAFSYQNDRLKDRVEELASTCGTDLVFPCDVSRDDDIQQLFAKLGDKWGGSMNGIVHSVAYAPADQLDGDYLDCINREGFQIAHDVSSYSLAALVKGGAPLLEAGKGSVLTLTYLGAERAVSNYNVMGLAKASLEANVRYLASSIGPKGVRVNGISAGPVRTLAAAGIKSFKKMLDHHQATTPLRENTTLEQVGNAAAFLCSDLASGITGEILHVDGGFHSIAF